jgi:ubiquinone/menaquinone biosynthesis C-methylase UbiE
LARVPRPKPLFIARQGRRPAGVLGFIVAWVMARETARDNGMAISLLGVQGGDRILDVGTGHGAALPRLAALGGTRVVGVDYSDVMIGVAKRRNRRLIRNGRVEVIASATDRMPFSDASFDKVMSMHTLYFWDPAEPHLREIARVLVPGGTFVLGFRPAEDQFIAIKLPAPVYRLRTTGEVERLLETCNFEIQRQERRDSPGDSMVWLVARRSAGKPVQG